MMSAEKRLKRTLRRHTRAVAVVSAVSTYGHHLAAAVCADHGWTVWADWAGRVAIGSACIAAPFFFASFLQTLDAKVFDENSNEHDS